MASSTAPTSPNSVTGEPTNPDASLFYELISTKKLPTHHLSLSTTPETPLYVVEMHEPIFRKNLSIILHTGSSKSDPVVGVVKLGNQRAKFITIGIGNPDAILEEGGDRSERMVWERLQRMETKSFRRYEFEYEGQLYTWRRTEDRWGWPGFLKVMELRAGKGDDGELVAVWKGTTRMNVKKGSFFLKSRGGGRSICENSRFEVVGLLTGLAIIENFRRRSR